MSTPVRPGQHRPIRAVGVAVSACLAGALAGFELANGWMLPALLGVGLVLIAALGYLAMTDVWTFALVLLATRSTLDVTNMQRPGGPGGVSGVGATAVSLLLVVTVVIWIAAQHRAGSTVLQPLSLAGIALACAAAVSAVGSVRPIVTLTEAARVGSSVAMLVLLTALVRSPSDVRRLLRVVYLSMVIPLTFAMVQSISSGVGTDASRASRIVGTFRHPNAFGAYLAVLLVAGVALIYATASIERMVLAALLTLGFIALVMTLSRGSWLATAIGLAVVAVVQRRPIVLVALSGLVILASSLPAVMARIADLAVSRSLAGTEGNSLIWRFDYWRQLLELADDHRATGIGLDMAQFVTVEANLPHNDYIRMYVEAGWIGLTTLLALVAVLIAAAVRATRLACTDIQLAVAAGFSGSLAAVLVIMVGGNVVSSVVLLWYFFAIAAAANAVALKDSTIDGPYQTSAPLDAGVGCYPLPCGHGGGQSP